MSFASSSYNRINRLIEKETIESTFSWGLRMAVAAIIPTLWGISTGRMADATWITLTAECICWVELKGSFGQGLRVLLAGIFLTLVFSTLGSLTAFNMWLSVGCMLVVGFMAGLFKNLGDRGSGLAVCMYVLFILANAYPVENGAEVLHRARFVAIGGLWNLFVGVFITLAIPSKEPYRRTIAFIWQSIASLTDVIAKGWDGNGTRNGIRQIYLKEKDVRTAMDTSFHFYESMAHQVSNKNEDEFQLAQFRKATALVATHITAISEELENTSLRNADLSLRLKLYAILKAFQQVAERMAIYVVTLKPEEELLLASRISRLNKLVVLLKEYPVEDGSDIREPLRRLIILGDRTIKLVESAMTRLMDMGDDKAVFRSYSLIKTIFILHPKHWFRNVRLLFDMNTFTARYALRASVAATIGLFVAKWFNIDHGYWIPFTALIVTQPYFGATLKKALDRVVGTILGGVAGGLLLRMPQMLYVKEIMLFLCFVCMVYFIRRNYATAAFFITFSLVLLFNFEAALDNNIIYIRALSTIGGALLAIIAGFALLPHWDKKYLPRNIFSAVGSNYSYFIAAFYSKDANTNWTRFKRTAESKNSNAFDSFNRYMEEPSLKKKSYSAYYHILMHNVRITRELNNIFLEREGTNIPTVPDADEQNKAQINECLKWFARNMEMVAAFEDSRVTYEPIGEAEPTVTSLTSLQKLYLGRMVIELKAVHSDLQNLAEKLK